VDVQEQLAQIRSAVENARSMPMSSSAVVNRSDLLEQIDAIAAELPRAFAAAEAITSDRDGVINEAHSKAEQIISDARLERDRLVSETEVYRMARESAERLLEDTRSEAEALRRETDEYVDGKLANFEISLTKILEAVSRGRGRLLGRSELDALRDEEVDKITLPGDGP
jgi:cell division septum initiation protein DivIVA